MRHPRRGEHKVKVTFKDYQEYNKMRQASEYQPNNNNMRDKMNRDRKSKRKAEQNLSKLKTAIKDVDSELNLASLT